MISAYFSKLGEKPDLMIDLEGSNFSADTQKEEELAIAITHVKVVNAGKSDLYSILTSSTRIHLISHRFNSFLKVHNKPICFFFPAWL